MRVTGHRDTFAQEHLPPRASWPQMRFDLLELQYPEYANCADRLLDRHVREGRGDRRCILWPGGSWSYAELQAASNRIARVLVEDLGLISGNRVLLRAPNTPMLAACWFAVMKAGGVAVTTMPLYRSGELAQMIAKAQISHALCDRRLWDDLESAIADRGVRAMRFQGAELEEHMATKAPHFENVATAAEDVAIIGFTSGTTGTPKAAMHFHRDILATCDTYGARVLQAQSADLFCGSPPLGFTFGLGGLLLFPLDCGAATLLLEKAPPDPLMEAIARYGVTVVFTAPIAYRAMADLTDRYDVRSLRACISAGETLPLPIFERWRDVTGLEIMDGIGSTEMLHIFIGSPRGRIVGGATGEVVPGYVAEIQDDDGNPLPDGEIGRLAVQGPTGCKYLEDDRQRRYVQNGWNYPGDAYRRDTNGYFYYVARADDMIISAGYNVSGPEVEQALLAHDAVKECAVVAKPDPVHHTNIVKAYVVLEVPFDEGVDGAAILQAFVRDRIASYKCPREVEFVEALPRTETGKVQRFKLRARAQE